MATKKRRIKDKKAMTLRGLRSKYGLTLEELTSHTSLTLSQIYSMEARNDLRNERFSHLMEISNYFNIPLFDLIEMNEVDKRENEHNPISQRNLN